MPQYFSSEGLEKLKTELEEREGKIRGDIAKRILEAKELGDLSENAEYAEAREQQAINEGRIEEIREILRSSVVVVDHPSTRGGIAVGSEVSVQVNKNEKKLVIVGPTESNPVAGFISYESPIGAALLGKKKGDEIEVITPAGKVRYKVLGVK